MSSNGGLAWQALIELLKLQKAYLHRLTAPLGLTPQLAHALTMIPPDGVTMRALAAEVGCDASNATGIVDRLERRGLLVRKADPDDRRIKRVCLTAEGERLSAAVTDAFRRTPPGIAALGEADQRVLREILDRAVANAAALRTESSA